MATKHEYLEEMRRVFPADSSSQLEAAASFAEVLFSANQIQNLTRLDSAVDFAEAHYRDAREFLIQVARQPAVFEQPFADLGSGCGVPGLLCAILSKASGAEQSWILIESEISKVEFLETTAELFHVEQTKVVHGRIEQVLIQGSDLKPKTLVARALGKVEKIYDWSRQCSTWNKMALFKSRGWDEEWAEAEKNMRRVKSGKILTVIQNIDYSDESRNRRIVVLEKK